MPVQNRDFDRSGIPRYVIWWGGPRLLDWCLPVGWEDLELREQVRLLGTYVCNGIGRRYVEVRVCWNVPEQRIQVESDGASGYRRGPDVGLKYALFATLPEALTYANAEVRRVHRALAAICCRTPEQRAEDERRIVEAARQTRARDVWATPVRHYPVLPPEQAARRVAQLRERLERRERVQRGLQRPAASRAQATTREARLSNNADLMDALRAEIRHYTP